MTAQALFRRKDSDRLKTTAAIVNSGDIQQGADGRAEVFVGLKAAAVGDRTGWTDEGIFQVVKTANIVILDGGRVFWDNSAGAAHFKTVNDRDFFLGTCVGDVAATDTSLLVNLNMRPSYEIDLNGSGPRSQGYWTCEATNGLGITLLPGGGCQLAFDGINEAAQAAIYSERTIPVAGNPILEARLAIFDDGNNAALNFNIGLANGSSSTDFELVTNCASVRMKGNSYELWAETKDSVANVAATDTTVLAVTATFFEVWIDARNPAAIAIYVDGVRVLPNTAFTLAGAAGPLKPIAILTKTTNATTGDVRIDFLRVRTATQ